MLEYYLFYLVTFIYLVMPKINSDNDINHRIIHIVQRQTGFCVSLQIVKAVRQAESIAEIEDLCKTGLTYSKNCYSLTTVKRPPRKTRNPQTGQEAHRGEMWDIKFKLNGFKKMFAEWIQRNGEPACKKKKKKNNQKGQSNGSENSIVK